MQSTVKLFRAIGNFEDAGGIFPPSVNPFFSGASIDMNFAQDLYLGAVPASLTVSNSGGTAYDTNNGWSQFGANTPRITNQGLLVEESRTNSIHNNTMAGAVAGVVGSGGSFPTGWVFDANLTGTLAWTVVDTGTFQGINYIDVQLSGTPTTSNFSRILWQNSGISASDGQTWTLSAFLALTGGSYANLISMNLGITEQGGAGQSDQGPSLISYLPSSLQNFSFIDTFTQSGTTGASPYLLFSWAANVPVNITVRIGWPQMELGAFATSPIPTSGAAVTRNADQVAFASLPSFGSSSSAYVSFIPNAPASYGNNQFGCQVLWTGGTTGFELFRESSNGEGAVLTSNGGNTVLTGPAASQNQLVKLAASIASGALNFCQGGGAVGNGAPTWPPSGSVISIHLGYAAGPSSWTNGYIQRVAFWESTAISNSQLQQITGQGGP